MASLPRLPSPRNRPEAPGDDGGEAAVAARFRYFLGQAGLDREQFVEAVDGAITARSLYSVLSGARRPSRALAVLIERTWGFSAGFLLRGEGAMWTQPRTPSGGQLSPAEAEVIAFMRHSVENAQTLASEVQRAQLWERMFARTMRLVAELERWAASDDPAKQASYPVFARLVLEESLFLAGRYELLAELRHDQRVHELTDAFVRRFVELLPRAMLDERVHDRLLGRLAPVRRRRRRAAAAREAAIAELVAAYEAIDASEPPHRRLLERSGVRRALAHDAALAELGPLVSGDAAAALERARATAPTVPTAEQAMGRLVEELAESLEPRAAPAAHTAAELQELHRRILVRLSD